MDTITSKEIQEYVDIFLKEQIKLNQMIEECDTMWCDAYIYGWKREDVPQNQKILDTIIEKSRDIINYCKQVSMKGE